MQDVGAFGEPWRLNTAGVEFSYGEISRCEDGIDPMGRSLFSVDSEEDLICADRAVKCVNACEGIEDPSEFRRHYDILMQACYDVERHQIITGGDLSHLSTTVHIVRNALNRVRREKGD
jgi:hypothetical protein